MNLWRWEEGESLIINQVLLTCIKDMMDVSDYEPFTMIYCRNLRLNGVTKADTASEDGSPS